MKACLQLLCIAVLLQGCSVQPESLSSAADGLAELRIDASPLLAANVNHVTVDAAGRTADLVQNPATGTFDGTLLAPAGMQTFVARAFSDQTLVGLSAAVPVVVQAGVVTRVVIRILDITSDPSPLFGPIFDALTFPTSVTAGDPASFSISVVAPLGDPITYAWSSSCPDSQFASPSAATTTWTRPTVGSCKIHVVATSNGVSINQSFSIVVFAAGSSDGAVAVNGVFVAKPVMEFSLDELDCMVNSFQSFDSSCSPTIASPDHATYHLNVLSWGASTPGELAVSAGCGGLIGTSERVADDVVGPWVPPVGGGVCIFTASATNGDGQTTGLQLAVLSRAGTALPPVDPPDQRAFIVAGNLFCSASGPGPAQCGAIAAGMSIRGFSFATWHSALSGVVTVIDSCAGPQSLAAVMDGEYISTSWTVAGEPGQMCTTTITATHLEGSSTTRTLQYEVGSP